MPELSVLIVAAAITSVFAFKYAIVYLGLRELIARRLDRQQRESSVDSDSTSREADKKRGHSENG